MSMVFSGLISNTKIKNTKLISQERKEEGREREREKCRDLGGRKQKNTKE